MWSIRDVTGTVAFDFQCYRWEITDAWFVQGRAWWWFAVMFLYLFGWKGIKLPVGKQKLNNQWSDLSIIQIVDAWWDHDKPYTPYRLKESLVLCSDIGFQCVSSIVSRCWWWKLNIILCPLVLIVQSTAVPRSLLCALIIRWNVHGDTNTINATGLRYGKSKRIQRGNKQFLMLTEWFKRQGSGLQRSNPLVPTKKNFVSNFLCTKME